MRKKYKNPLSLLERLCEVHFAPEISQDFDGLSQLMKQWYDLRKREETVQVLEDYPLLYTYFVDIHRHILMYFPGAKLFLEAVADSEAVDDLEVASENENVVVSVVTHLQAREAIERLKQFYRDWWLRAPNRAKMKDKISFNVDGVCKITKQCDLAGQDTHSSGCREEAVYCINRPNVSLADIT
jgi:hypothetical protein